MKDVIALPSRPIERLPARRALIGWRELALIALALLLLAVSPGFAGFGHAEPVPVPTWRPAGAGPAERPEDNFPGSAFYFLDPADAAASGPAAALPAIAATDGPMANAFNSTDLVDPSAGPAARPFVVPAGGIAYARALKCLTDAIYYEGAAEPDVGQRAIAQVILNRVRHPSFPNSVCGVIYQGSERASGCQFSYSCDGSMARVPMAAWWNRARRVALAALAGSVYAPVGLATHYHTSEVSPWWAPSLTFVGTVGAHRFYRWQGAAGTPAAFFARYAAWEPMPGPHPRAFVPAPLIDPIELQRQFERDYNAGLLKAQMVAASPAPAQAAPVSYAAPAYSAAAKAAGGESAYGGSRLPDDSGIRAEYQASGSWKAMPTQ